MTQQQVIELVVKERDRQDRRWGGGDHDAEHNPNDWVALIAKHAGRAAFRDDPDDFRECMIQVAALAIAALEVA